MTKSNDKYSMYYSLSGSDIEKMLPNAKVMLYSDLLKYPTLKDLLDENKIIVILYRSSDYYGHWNCLFKRNDGQIEVFDSYGFYPDDFNDKINDNKKVKLSQDYPYLCKLLYESPYKLNYNEYKLQGLEDPSVSTCGRHCVTRILMKDRYIDIDDYVFDMFYHRNKNPDYVVTEFTNKLF